MPKKSSKKVEKKENTAMEIDEEVEKKPLPEELEAMRTMVTCTEDHPVDAQSTYCGGTFAAHGRAYAPIKNFVIEELMPSLSMKPCSDKGEEQIIFDVVGIKPSLANALRRIMLAEVPTMAIEKVWFFDNTSVIPDEMLAHRMGLLPIKVDPNDFEFLNGNKEFAAVDQDTVEQKPKADETASTAVNEAAEASAAVDEMDNDDPGYSDTNTLVFHLDVRCEKVKDPVSGEEKLLHTSVYSGDFEWVPQGSQEEFYGDNKPCFVSDKILLAKLRENQHIQCDCYAFKGIGKDHAKFSPVGTASYRLHPCIRITGDLPEGKTAEELVSICPMGVFDIEDGVPVVKNPRNCTMCRNCIRHEFGFSDVLTIGRVKDHYIFSVESVGAIPAHDIFIRALDVLDQKCEKIINALAKI